MVVNCSKTYNLGAEKLARFYGEEMFTPKRWPTPIDLQLAETVRASAIFSWDLPRLRSVTSDALFYGCNVEAGGPAVIFNASRLDLPGVRIHIGTHEAEAIAGEFPMTWTTRGCIRDCPWCIVPSIEGRTVSPADQIEYAPLILDNNFLAAPEDHIRYILKVWSGKKVDWNQGLDARLYTPRFREMVQEYGVRPTVWRFAYDFGGVGRFVRDAVKDLRGHGVPYNKIRIYLLFNYDETPAEARKRAEEIIAWGASPWPMAYKPLDWESEEYYVSKHWTRRQVVDFRRFFSRGQFWRSMTFDDYDYKIA